MSLRRISSGRKPWLALSVALAACVGMAGGASAQAPKGKEFSIADRDALNANTVTVISGNPNGTYIFLAFDLASVLDQGDTLRVLPVGGKGGYQNVKDLLFLKGVDLAITQSNVLTHMKKTGELGRNIDQRLTYIAKLYNEEVHILAGEGINSINDLEGKTVNLSDVGSGTQFSTRLIFEALKIKVTEVNMGQNDAYEALKSKRIAATVLIAGKPAGSFARFKLEPGMKLLPIPYAEALENDYFPTRLTNDDYPTLIEKGKTVDTVAVGAVLATINWAPGSDRNRRVTKFTEAFFAKIGEFRKAPRHGKWKETNLTADLPGWTRYPAAKALIDALPKTPVAAIPAPGAATAAAPSRKTFSDFLAQQRAGGAAGAAPAATEEAMYARFLEWMKSQGGAPAAGGTTTGSTPPPAGAPGGTRLW